MLTGLGAIAAGAAAPVLTLPTPARAATPVKYRPGHYVWPPTLYWTPERRAGTYALIDSVATNPYIKGFVLHLNWAYFESTPGNYSTGFEIVDDLLRKLASLPTQKYLIMQTEERAFGANPTTNVYPPYVINNGWVAVKPADQTWAGNLVSVARMWQTNVMDRLIAMSAAYAARYNTNSRLVMYGLGETSLGPPAGTGFTADAYYSQLKRWFTESKKVWTQTPLRLCANYTRNDADMLNLFSQTTSTVVPGGVAIGGPDPELPLPDVARTIQANRLFRGESPAPLDRRGVAPWVAEVEEFGLGVRYTETPQEIFDYYYSRMHCNYMIWMANTSVGGDPQRWPAILAFINSIQGRIWSGPPTVGIWTPA